MASEAPSVPERQGPDPTEIPDGFSGPFFRDVGKRKEQDRDVKIIITAKDGQTGVGKSNLTDFLAHVLDTSSGGFHEGKATIQPQKFLELYSELPPGSSLVMEEGGQFDARRATSNKNVDATHKWQMARVREICALINLPSPDDIDSRFERLADYWINVERRGFARIYKKRIHPIKRKIYYETCQTLEWPNMDKSKTFKSMARMKDEMLADDSSDNNWVRESEVKKRVSRARKETKQEVRDKLLTSIYKDLGVSASELARAPAVEISDGRIRQIANERR